MEFNARRRSIARVVWPIIVVIVYAATYLRRLVLMVLHYQVRWHQRRHRTHRRACVSVCDLLRTDRVKHSGSILPSSKQPGDRRWIDHSCAELLLSFASRDNARVVVRCRQHLRGAVGRALTAGGILSLPPRIW